MRNTLILTAVAFAAFSMPAFAQSTPAQPVMPAPRVDANPNVNVVPMENNSVGVPEGRAAAPMERMAPGGRERAPARGGE